MTKLLSYFVLLGVVIGAVRVTTAQQKKIYPDRWLYLNVNFNSDKGLEEASDLIHTAAEHGLNAVVLLNMDSLSLASPEYLARLVNVKEVADANHMEIIPAGFKTNIPQGSFNIGASTVQFPINYPTAANPQYISTGALMGFFGGKFGGILDNLEANFLIRAT